MGFGEHHLETGRGLSPLVSALVVFSKGLLPGGTMTMLRERASVERASEELEKLAATDRQQKTIKGCEGHAFSKAGDACVAVGVSTREDASGER